MATYVTLIRYTEQGAANVGDTQRRAAAFRDAAGKSGVTVRELYWTLGSYDGLVVLDAPNEEAVTAAMVGLGALGNVRTETLRAFDESQIGGIIERAGVGESAAGRGAKAGGARKAGATGGTGRPGR